MSNCSKHEFQGPLIKSKALRSRRRNGFKRNKGSNRTPRAKFRLNWLGLYITKTIMTSAVVKLMDMDGEEYTQYTNVNRLKKYYV